MSLFDWHSKVTIPSFNTTSCVALLSLYYLCYFYCLQVINKMAINPTKSIPAFFAGQSIFLTGATGFLGKSFIEKVLRSCPDVREIFVLIRPKKGLSVNQRLETILKLPVLLYVSTALTNIQEPFIEEKVYPPIFDWKKMIEVAELLDDEHVLNVFTAKFLESAANTYVFSKNLAESIIQEYSSSLPCAIVRPSLVYPSLTEPMPGWIDNIYGSIGLYIGGAKGIIHIAYADKHVCGKIVPIDIVIKVILVVCWKIGLTTFTADSTLFVLNCVYQHSLTLEGETIIMQNILKEEVPFEGKVWRTYKRITDNYILYYIGSMLLHIFPAVLIDLALKCLGRQPMLLQLQRKLYVANLALFHFGSNDWKFDNTNKSLLISTIPLEDQDTFSFDYANCDIKEYYKNCVIGIKKYLLHEKMDISRLHPLILRNKRVDLFASTIETIIVFSMLWIIYKLIF
ncbi:fatty acyl-CoA reductase 1 isoform X2 [Solenopsis invicta]|uniref:fatty acyl-CoA reductase 1 isoform X2 n=1 Tax=Solenopsis invicta TaxID=13686 RepID=UPI000E33FBA7|nr:fatty acyl-CoA reductase 1 isoform X2 [Solenopsis invicta]